MFRIGTYLIAGVCLLLTPFYSAAAESGRLGAGVTFYAIDIDDPAGHVPDAAEAGLHFVYLDELSRDTRYYAEFSYVSVEIGADAGKIGQDATRFGIGAALQTRFRRFRSFKPWLGIGGGLYQEEFTRRHSVDSAGFLTGTYPDRDVTQFVISFDAMHEWELTRNMDLAVRVKYEMGFNEGIDGLSASMTIFY